MKDFLHTRRCFLQRSVALLAATPTIPLFLGNTAMALNAPGDGLRNEQHTGKDGKILVVVQLSGGNDGLNMIVPFADDNYQRLRPAIGKKPDEVLKINDHVGLNGKMSPLKALYDNGQMSIVQGVGYPNPNRSHFRSMDIWQTAVPEDERLTSGWLGRYFDSQCAGNETRNIAAGVTRSPTTRPTPMADQAGMGVAIGGVSPLAMRSEHVSILNFERPDAFRYKGRSPDAYLDINKLNDAEQTAAAKAPTRPGQKPAAPSAGDQLDFLSRTALDAQASSDRILKATSAHKPGVEYPRGDFGEGLKTIAAMIRAEMPTRVYYVSLGGFDTHANQADRHDKLMETLASGIGSFMADLKDQKNDQRVMMMTFSEFGRRVAQNASGGTDHGAAAPVMLFGSRLKQGLAGTHPSLTDLDSGDLKFAVDFRSVYASLLQNWLETPSKPILGRQFQTFDLVHG